MTPPSLADGAPPELAPMTASDEAHRTDTPDGHRAGGSHAVARLTALWGLVEVGLGGALHALRLPLTGLLVGSSAVVLLALIAEAARRDGRSVRRTLLGATAVVLGVKAAASPHSPVGAYLAVAFQGGLATLALPTLGRRLGPLVLGVVALAESAVQRVLVMTILFGAAFWDAVDALVDLATRQLGAVVGADLGGAGSGSVWLVSVYIGVHLVVGGVVGVLAARVPKRAFRAAQRPSAVALARAGRDRSDERTARAARTPRPWYARPPIRRLGLAALLLAAYAALGLTEGSARPAADAAVAVVRAAVLLALWTTVVAPLALRLVHRLAGRSRRGADVARAAEQIPELRAIAGLAWRKTRGRGGARPLAFAVLVSAAALTSGERRGERPDAP
ncbi:hypothetical protein RQM47_11045 [Rubrivirga sp. S365]|uniref:Uncharacterized protein n=1 Tax=Rubrivirga litoralis TaxID=3075598 RepID=A0ABU3BTZ9_9BACT|nr:MULTISPECIES: hypothetical protein [unclassified Rubrivirga]MDT0632646.1 hypothetical protein [Rubrivirga sp. F394]MDT7857177.1 hypothetical protein [Rubrivirga sp. S365]